MTTFSDFVSSPVLAKNLAAGKFVTPTPIQAQAIPPALAGRDLVATAQTGTGKTLAFVLPIIEHLSGSPRGGPQALILSPTRELALQIQAAFDLLARGAGLRSAVAIGGMSESAQLKAIRAGAPVLIATPGRLCDYLNRKLISLAQVRFAVLDEADRMLDMGFLPAVESILKQTPSERQTLLFSATFDNTVARLAARHLKNPERIAVGSTTRPAEQIETRHYEIDREAKLPLLLHLLKDEPGSFLVFARTKHGADRLAKRLASAGVKAAAIHGDRTQNQRNAALRGFQDGGYRVLVATDVAARGIHVDNIAHVVNFDLPQQPEDFIHRIGRTGRAGARGIASTFAESSERAELRAIERSLGMRLTIKETPAGLDVPVTPRPAPAVIPIPKAQPSGRVRSFRPGRRRASR